MVWRTRLYESRAGRHHAPTLPPSPDTSPIIAHPPHRGHAVQDRLRKVEENRRKLESLGLGGTNVTDASLKHLSGLTELRAFGLAQTKVTGQGLEHLPGTKLVQLYLTATNANDAGMKAVGRFTALMERILVRSLATPDTPCTTPP